MIRPMMKCIECNSIVHRPCKLAEIDDNNTLMVTCCDECPFSDWSDGYEAFTTTHVRTQIRYMKGGKLGVHSSYTVPARCPLPDAPDDIAMNVKYKAIPNWERFKPVED